MHAISDQREGALRSVGLHPQGAALPAVGSTARVWVLKERELKPKERGDIGGVSQEQPLGGDAKSHNPLPILAPDAVEAKVGGVCADLVPELPLVSARIRGTRTYPKQCLFNG